MSTIIGGSSPSVTFPDSTVQDTSAIVGGKVPYANLPAGSVLQVVQATSTSSVSTTSTSFVTTGYLASITPKFSTSKILVIACMPCYINTTATAKAAIYRNASQICETVTEAPSSGSMGSSNILSYLDSPATTSATTYTIYFKTSSGATYMNADASGLTSITLMEIAG